MTAARCSRCYRDATLELRGTFRNARPAVELVCSRDAPDLADVGTFRILGRSEYRLSTITRIAALEAHHRAHQGAEPEIDLRPVDELPARLRASSGGYR